MVPELAGVLMYVAYFLGAFKITKVVERWPDGIVWVILGFATLVAYLALLVTAWWVIAG